MKTLRKTLSAVLVVLMLLTSAPLQGIVGLDISLPDFFSSEAKAAGVPGYSAGAAVKWAIDHYNDIDSILTGKGYWSEGGDCANFVSQCVYMGGIDMKNKWYSNGYWRVWDPFTWIRAHELYEYMVELGGQSINNPKASDLSIGDLIFYKTRSDGKMHHSAIVVDIQNGVPIICAHSVLNDAGVYEKYMDPNWTLGYSGSRIYAVKMYGDMCEADNPRNFTVYTAKSGARKNLYSSPSTSSPVIGSTMAESYTYIHVYEERTVNGIRWGKMQWAGNWAWTKLSGFNRIRDISSYVPTHDFGAWKTIAIANCVNDGITERICKRCGYTQKNTTPKKGHVPGASATCLTPQVCTVCDTVLVDALGHDFEGGLKMPTCTEAASGSYTCTRCDFSYDITEKWTEYTVPLQEYNGHYYQLFNDAMTWQEAKELCEGLRGHLIVINDEAEQNFMTELVADASKDNLWIGLYSDDDTLSWKWVNGEEVGYTNWGGLEPTEDITELYVHTYARDYNANKPAGVWNNMQNNGVGSAGGDYYTPSNYGFICEWDSYEDYPDIWKEETSASIKSETGYTYKEKETVTSYETSLDGYTQDGGSWEKSDSGTIDYVAEWPPNTCTTEGFNTNNYYFSQYNKTPKYPSQTETTKVEVSTSTVGYLYWHWCYRHSLGRIENCRISDGYDYPIGNYRTDTFHAFFSSNPITYNSSATSFECYDSNKCPYTYWWIGKNIGTSNQLPVLRCNWTSYNRLFNYYKWSDNLGYTDKANLPDSVVSMIDNGTANSNYELGDTKTLYSYRLDALGHQMGEWYTVTVATCLENGIERRDCQRCDYYETEETTAPCVEVKDEAVAPTCKDTGLTEGSHCGVCGKTITEQQIVPTTEHPFGNWNEVYPISCGKDGLEERVCSFCGFTDQRAIVNPNPDHLGPVTEKVITPGCEHLHAQGWTEYHCEKCDEQWTDNFTDPLAAVWGEWTVTVQPDCSINPSKDPAENGERERVCQLCGMIDKETLIAEHNLVVYDVSSSCTTGGEKGEKCTVCNQIWTDGLDPLGHLLYDDWYTVYEAKCEEPGLERRDCNRSGCEYFETRIIDPINHDYKNIKTVKATCDKQGYIHYVCNNDNSHVFIDYNEPELGHVADNVWVLIKSPTCTEKGEEQCKCIRHDNGLTCSKTYSREIDVDPNAHNWDYGVINPESTCKLHGTKTYTCQNDNSHKKTESVALNPDNHVGEIYIKDAKTETCTADGYTGDKYCSDCDELLEKGEAIAKLGHDMGEWSDNNNSTHTRECQRDNGCTYTETENCKFGDWVVTKEATCTAKGSKERVCTVCGYKETAEIQLKDHIAGEAVIENEVAPKCEVKGSYDEVVYCTECTKELSRVKKDIAPIGHDWDNGVINPESTCKLHGTKTYTCQNDSSHKKTESVALNPNNHVGETYIKDAKTENCTEDGYTGDKYCSDCDALLEKGKSIDKLGHDMGKWSDNKNGTHTRECQRDNGCTYTETENCKFGDWVVTKEATCTAKGSKERVCTVCGYKETATIEIKAHTPGEVVTENRVDPKCEVKGSYDEVVYCTECTKELSRVKKDIAPIGHDWDNGVINPESTCKLHGTKTYTCQNDNSHKKTESVALNPDNHVGETYIRDAKAETCTEDGYTGDKYCSDCDALLEKGKAIAKLGHDWGEWKVSKDATIDAKGEEKRICKRDSSHIETRETEKLVSYIAYFIVPDENGDFEYNGKKYNLIDDIRFTPGGSISVPDVPELDGHIGSWKAYDTNKNEDIYIEAFYEPKSSDNQSDLISEKDVVYKDGIATITLSAFAETLNAKVPMGATPCDIILVLDQSSSMTSYKIGKETRLAVLKRVAKNFVDTVYESAEENDVDHRIALVSFSGTAENYKGTGLIGTNGSIKTFNKLTDADYASAFVDVNGNLNALKNGIDSLTGIRGTSSDYGLQMARQILANNKDGREKLVLFITDGEPGDPGRNMGAFNSTVANDAIEYANQIKNIYGTTIYSIGVAAGADPSDETNKINKFLHYVSSNYPNAKSMDNKGSAATMKNYFLSAEDADEIEKMFESIVSRQIVNTISFTKVNFYDTISEYFTLTTENENALREAVKSEYGVSDSDIIITRNADGTTTVRINNLVPKAVFNEKNVQIGYGATVKFDVTANEKTLEGGTFVTNTEDAGIENGGKTVIEFKVPDGKEISSGRAIVEFRIGDEVYAIREVSIGDKVVVPETDVADWVVTDGTTITSDYTVFNTEYTTETRTVKWIIDGVTKEETYHIGEIIFAPQINNPDGKLFKGWNAKVPYRMPDYNLEFAAIFETHEHNYKQTAINGECITGVTYTYTCDCKDSYTKTETYDAHKFTANVQLVNNESVATMTCTVCGKADSKVINYKAQYETNSWWNKTTKVVDLTLYDNAGISIQPDGYVYVKLYEEGDVLSNAKSGKLIIKRVNEDGSEDNIPYLKNSSVDKTGYYVEGNYIVLKLDHFSYYALIMPEDATNVPTYGEIECAFNGHSYTSKVTAPTCKSEGYTTYTCSVCGDSYTGDKTDKAAHKYKKNVTSANCTDKGYTTYVCNVCGHSYKDNYTSALGHSMGAYVVTKQPTCTDKGTETATCSRCTHTETKSVAAKGHNYKNNVCTNCGKSKVENCTHLCHKKGFMGFIWKIVRFFWKLFKMNPVCECGVKHY